MKAPRFFCPNFQVGMLDENESHHLLRVLRLKAGQSIVLFNGQGEQADARVLREERKRVLFEILKASQAPPPSGKLVLALGLLKPKAMDLVLQKATELGVSEIWPLLCQRSALNLSVDQREQKSEKWHQTLIEACKQCGLNWLPQLHPISSLEEFLSKIDKDAQALRLIASLQADAKPLPDILEAHPMQSGRAIFLVGPEGDFTCHELDHARREGFLPVSLGSNVLRSETATIFLSSVLTYQLQKRPLSKLANHDAISRQLPSPSPEFDLHNRPRASCNTQSASSDPISKGI